MAHLQALTQAQASQEAYLRHRRANCYMVGLVAAAAPRYYAECHFFQAAISQLCTHRSDVGSRSCLVAIPGASKDQLGMGKHVFRNFVKKLSILTNASHTQHVDLSEQVAIFLYTIVTKLLNRKVGNTSRGVVILSQSIFWPSDLSYHGSFLPVY